jgi:hypothetical protein
MVRRKLDRRCRNVTEGGGKATRKNYLTAPRSQGREDCENGSRADRRQTDRQLIFGIQTGSLVCQKTNKKTMKSLRNQPQNRAPINHIPAFKPERIYTRKVRFLCGSAFVAQSITAGNLIQTWLMAATATTGYPLADAVQLSRVSLYATPAAIGGSATVAIEFQGSAAGGLGTGAAPNTSFSDTSVSVSELARVSRQPPPNSQAAWWFDRESITTANPFLFTFTTPIGGILDIEYNFTLSTTEVAGTALTLIAATAGTTYQFTQIANLAAVAPFNTI